MSVTYSAQVICGFKIEEREIVALETRYNHLTGEPYKIEVKGVKFFIGDIYEEKFHELDVIKAGEGWARNIFLGEVIAATGEHYSTYDEFLINIPAKVRAFGEEMGINPSFFLTFDCS